MKDFVIIVLALLLAAALAALVWQQRAPAAAALPADATLEPAAPRIDVDSSRVREGVSRGELVPLEPLLADAEARYPGRVLEVELEGREYEIEILQADGTVIELTYDARTGALLEVELEDD